MFKAFLAPQFVFKYAVSKSPHKLTSSITSKHHFTPTSIITTSFSSTTRQTNGQNDSSRKLGRDSVKNVDFHNSSKSVKSSSFSDTARDRNLYPSSSSKLKYEKISNDVFSMANAQHLETVLDIYRFTVTQLNQHNVDYGHTTVNAYEDASFLILHELALPNDSDIRNWFAAKLTVKEKEHLLKLIRRRCVDRIPSPYLVGGCYQQGLYFMVDEHVLIPRSFIGEILFKWQKLTQDIEKKTSHLQTSQSIPSLSATTPEDFELDYNDYISEFIDDKNNDTDTDRAVEGISSTIKDDINPVNNVSSHTNTNNNNHVYSDQLIPLPLSNIHRVLDMCTGSGCLAILAAKFLPQVEHVDAVDLSSDALTIADDNVESHGLDEVIDLHQGDLFEALPKSRRGYYDLIISNPPYVTKEDMQHLPDEYAKEPALALVAGNEGIDLIERILQQSPLFLSENGYLLCEIGQTAEVLERKYGAVFAKTRSYRVSGDAWQQSLLHGSAATASSTTSISSDEKNSDAAESVLWIETELSQREVFLASKSCLQVLAKKIKIVPSASSSSTTASVNKTSVKKGKVNIHKEANTNTTDIR